MTGFGDLSLVTLGIIALAALVGSFASSLTGTGGAIVLSLALAPIVGVGALVPILSVTMAVSHAVRIGAFRHEIDRRAAGLILAGALPGAIAGSLVLVRLDERAIALGLGVFLILIVVARRLIAGRRVSLPAPVIVMLACGYGFLAGLTIGGGILVLPLLGAAGLAGARLVATDALVGLVIHTVKSIVFGAAAALTPALFLAGVMIGVLMIPGTFAARAVLARMPIRFHENMIDLVILLGALNFLMR